MSYDSNTRDRYRLAVRATTASVAAGAMTATGWLAGAAAQDQAQVTAEKQAAQDARQAAQKPTTIVRERPTTTRVTTRYITAARSSDPIGNGGDVNSDSSDSGSNQGSSAPAQDNSAPAPPPPPPPPAPSNGS